MDAPARMQLSSHLNPKEVPMSNIKTKRSLGMQPFLYPQPALLVCTYDAEGKPNVMNAAWGGICSSDPVSLAVSIRPMRWTHDAILSRKAFTVGIPSESMVVAADYVGIASGRRYDKFSISGLTPVKSEKVDAPYVAECPVVLECLLTESHVIGVHTMMIGAIQDVKVNEDCFDPSGQFPDITKIAPLIFDSGSGNYFGIGKHIAKAFSVGKPLLKQDDDNA